MVIPELALRPQFAALLLRRHRVAVWRQESSRVSAGRLPLKVLISLTPGPASLSCRFDSDSFLLNTKL